MANTFWINTTVKMYSLNGNNYHSVDRFKAEMDIQGNIVIFNEREDAIGNDIYSNAVMRINVSTDTVNVDGTARAPGYFTPITLVQLFQTVFPKANTGNGGSGSGLSTDQQLYLNNLIATIPDPSQIIIQGQ